MLKTVEVYGEGGYCAVCVPGTPGHMHPLHNVIDIYDIQVPDDPPPPTAPRSAYEEWLALGNVGTPAQFIASLKGAKGDPGTNGLDGLRGLPGVDGAKGADGTTGARGPAGIGGWTVLADAAALAWTNMPSGATELFGSATRRTKKNLSGATQARVIVNQTVIGSAQAALKLQYSTDGAQWADAGPSVAVGASTGLKVGAFANLVAAAKADVFLRLVGASGDGVADPAFSNIDVEFA